MIVTIQLNVDRSSGEMSPRQVADALGISTDGDIFLIEDNDGDTVEVNYVNSWVANPWEVAK